MRKLKTILSVVVAVLITIGAVGAVTMSVDELLQFQQGGDLGAVANPFYVPFQLNTQGNIEAGLDIAATDIWATTTLTVADSGKTIYLSASGTTITLPTATDGANFRFVVGGALDTGNVIIDSAEGDNIEGALIVAGAVVDCAAEDQINIVIDGENLGDYVELRSNGTNWYIGDSGALSGSKMTCTDPA